MPDNQPKKMSQADFLAKIRKEVPELATFKDNDVMDKIFQTRPEIRDMIETPDDVAARNQLQLEQRSKSLVNPQFWQNHPNMAEFSRQVLNSLPGVGGVLGGAAGEGIGSIPLMALGAGGGRGIRDILAQSMGLESPTNLANKFTNAGTDAGLTAVGAKVIPGIPAGISATLDDPADAARGLAQFYSKLTPKFVRYLVSPQALEDFVAGGGDKTLGESEFSKFLKSTDIPAESNEPVSTETPKADTKINNAKKVTLHLN